MSHVDYGFIAHTARPPGTRLHERRCTVWSCFKFTHTQTTVADALVQTTVHEVWV
jgi:hypothetical protein